MHQDMNHNKLFRHANTGKRSGAWSNQLNFWPVEGSNAQSSVHTTRKKYKKKKKKKQNSYARRAPDRFFSLASVTLLSIDVLFSCFYFMLCSPSTTYVAVLMCSEDNFTTTRKKRVCSTRVFHPCVPLKVRNTHQQRGPNQNRIFRLTRLHEAALYWSGFKSNYLCPCKHSYFLALWFHSINNVVHSS